MNQIPPPVTERDLSHAIPALPTLGDGQPAWQVLEMTFEDGMVLTIAGRLIWVPVTEQQCLDALRADPSPRAQAYVKAYERSDREACRRIATRIRYESQDNDRDAERLRAAKAGNARRARKVGALGSHTEAEWHAILGRHRHRCASCHGKGRLEKDHIIPLARGGSNYALNLQPLCKWCNSAKSARIQPGTQYAIFDRADA